MPDSSGQMQFKDYVAELQDRGFDGFSADALKAMVNRGYFYVARKYALSWAKASETFTLPAGQFKLTVGKSGEIMPFFRGLDTLYIIDPATTRAKLTPLSDEDFFQQWLPLDLTLNRTTPTNYYVFESDLYILPAPPVDTQLRAHFTQRVMAMVENEDVPITPIHLDEAILTAALVRCHKRSQETGLAQIAEADLAEFFDDILDDEEEIMTEQPDRTLPDDTWL